MERVEAFSNLREMTPEVLLELTQSIKFHQVRRAFSYDLGLHSNLLITQEDIEDTADSLKAIVFFIPGCVYRETIELAKERGVLRIESNWLKEELV